MNRISSSGLVALALAFPSLSDAQNALWYQSGNQVLIDVFDRQGSCTALRGAGRTILHLEGAFGVPNTREFQVGEGFKCWAAQTGKGVAQCRKGSVTISGSGGGYRGTYDVTLENGQTLQGQFAAAKCPASQL